jgi:protein arginine phosphatase
MNILFVCTANISRSFLSEKLFKDEIIKHGMNDIGVASAGVLAMSGSPADPKMVHYLESLGISPGVHASRPLDKDNMEWADLVLVMEKKHYQRIQSLFPDSIHKVEMLGKYVSMDGSEDDVVDPFGRSSYHYRLSQSQIRMGLEGVLKKIQFDRLGV